MRKTKEVLRLRLGLGQRQIARSCGMGLGTVHDYLERAAAGFHGHYSTRLTFSAVSAGEQQGNARLALDSVAGSLTSLD